MRSFILKEETKRYYMHSYKLLPFWMVLIFTLLIFIFYNLFLVIFYGEGFQLNLLTIIIGVVFGFVEAITTIIMKMKNIDKKYNYFNNLNKNSKTDFFVSVIHKNGFFKSSSGVLIISKDFIEYRIYSSFEKKSLFEIPNKNIISMEIKREENSLVDKILTLSKDVNYLYVKTNNEEYKFVITSLDEITQKIPNINIKTV